MRKSEYFGYKVRNRSGRDIFVNISRVDDDGKDACTGDLRGELCKSVPIPSSWSWNAPHAAGAGAGADDHTWVVWPAQLSQNYTTFLSIGDADARVEMFLTGDEMENGFDKCQGDALCEGVSGVHKQFQIAFPVVEVRIIYLHSFRK